MRLLGAGIVCCAALLSWPGAAEAQQEPVELTVDAPAVVPARAPFRLGVEVNADPGALDVSARPLRLRVALEPECGASFAGSEGPVAIDRAVPAPSAGSAYRFTGGGSARVGSFGPETVCAFLEDDEERQFATSTDTVLEVSRACTSANRRLIGLRRAARQARRKRSGELRRKLRRATRRRRAACRIGQSAVASRSTPAAPTAETSAAHAMPRIRHLFIIVLENKDAGRTFGANPPSPYLGKTLPDAGALIPDYYGIGHESLDNYIAMVSGQPPNIQSQADCQIFGEMLPGTLSSDGIAVGQGCVYPAGVKTVADQLEAAGRSWHGYMQDMAASAAAGAPSSCRHPALGAPDDTQTARSNDQYAVRHDPFVYFRSIIDSPSCRANVVDLRSLAGHLSSEATTPDYSFIAPDLCADGHDETCADGTSPGGFAGIDAFLREWVPRIEASPAYQDRGMIMVTFDESESGAASCCGETTGPNTPNNGGPDFGSGGGRVGAVMVSPCIEPGTVSDADYNHYSLLRWVEDNFGLGHLANAAPAAVGSFGPDVLTRPGCSQGASLSVRPRTARAGRRTTFRLRLRADLPICMDSAAIRFAGRRLTTDADGEASVTLRLRGHRRRMASAVPRICEQATATVRVRPSGRRR